MLNKKLGLFVVLAGFAASSVMAQSLESYTSGDVLLCFRGGGSDDLVVDAGSVTNFINQAHNTRALVSNYMGTQLSFVGTNSVDWSAFTWLYNNTLFVTEARASLNVQTVPWTDQTSGNQALTASHMGTIPPGTVDEFSFNPDSSTTAVIEQDNSSGNPNYPTGQSYHDALDGGYGSQWDGTFQGNCENTTPSSFTTSGTVVRSDFYEMTPNSGRPTAATWLGYFEFDTNGDTTFVAYPDSIPVITSISRAGNVSTINYTTGVYGNYTLVSSYSLTTPLSSWTTVTTLSTGDAKIHSITDTDASGVKFYAIIAN